jgi:hypothetical protein
MAGRLIEVPRKTADEMLAILTANADRILLYVYPGWYMTLPEVAGQLGLDLEPHTDGVALVSNGTDEPVLTENTICAGMTDKIS